MVIYMAEGCVPTHGTDDPYEFALQVATPLTRTPTPCPDPKASEPER